MPAHDKGHWVPEYENGIPTRMRWEWTHARSTDPVTSHEAASLTHNQATMLDTLATVYRAHHPRGLTASEAAHYAGYSEADGAWKRVSDLLADGLIESTGQTRPGPHGRMQRVLRWVPTDPEQDELW